MPVLLFIDTSSSIATVALAREGRIAALVRHREPKEQAAVINGMIREVFRDGGSTPGQMDGICICAGPGSYTGLRVGLGLAKGMAFALDKPLMLFDRMRLIALHAGTVQPLSRPKSLVLRARKGEYFYARFDAENRPIEPPQHIFAAALDNRLPAGEFLVTDDPEFKPELQRFLLPEGLELAPEPWLQLALDRWGAAQFDDLAYSEPFYLKPAYTTSPKQ